MQDLIHLVSANAFRLLLLASVLVYLAPCFFARQLTFAWWLSLWRILICRMNIQGHPTDWNAYRELGDILFGLERFSSARDMYSDELISSDDWYNRACLEAVRGDSMKAFEHLNRAVKDQDFDRDWAWRDPDLESVRGDQRFGEIVGPQSELKETQ